MECAVTGNSRRERLYSEYFCTGEQVYCDDTNQGKFQFGENERRPVQTRTCTRSAIQLFLSSASE